MRHRGLWVHGVLLALFAFTLGCKAEPPPAKQNTPAVKALLPTEAGAFKPSMAALASGQDYNASPHTEIKLCESCHPDHTSQWRQSTHALSSFNNPFYLVSFESYVQEVGQDKGGFCGGCHDPTLVFNHKIKDTIEPENIENYLGITCNSCHGITAATSDGVASYTLDTSPIPIPVDEDPTSLAAHRKRLGSPIVKEDTLCISCHKGFLSEASGHKVFLPALDEHGPWRRSGFSSPVSASRILPPHPIQSCRDCHMPADENSDVLHSHRFPGGHTTLANAAGQTEQLKVIETMLKNRVAIDIPAWREASGAWKPTDSESRPKTSNLQIDVVISNIDVGHHYPAGARDLRNVWVELSLVDASEKVIAQSGHQHAVQGPEEDVHVLQVGLVDDNGQLVKTHGVGHFRTPLFDQTIGPADSKAARYQFEAPDNIVWPLKMKARLLQQRYSKAFFDEVCRASKTTGEPFREKAKTSIGIDIDPCLPQPTTLMAEVTAFIGKETKTSTPRWLRWYRHGLALKHDLQERLNYAAASFKNALARHPETNPVIERAMIHGSLAEVFVKQSRLKEASKNLDIADRLAPNQPSVARLRGEALRKVWKIKEAIPHFQKAAELAPTDERRWKDLAAAYGSVGLHGQALKAAQTGLKIEPRDAHLLRLQMLALEKSNLSNETGARETFLNYKIDEAAAGVKSKCSDQSSECRKARLPLRTYQLKKNNIIEK